MTDKPGSPDRFHEEKAAYTVRGSEAPDVPFSRLDSMNPEHLWRWMDELRELARGIDDWEQRLGTALVKSSPTDLVRHQPEPESQKPKVKSQK